MSKKIITLFLVNLLILYLIGCNEKNISTNNKINNKEIACENVELTKEIILKAHNDHGLSGNLDILYRIISDNKAIVILSLSYGSKDDYQYNKINFKFENNEWIFEKYESNIGENYMDKLPAWARNKKLTYKEVELSKTQIIEEYSKKGRNNGTVVEKIIDDNKAVVVLFEVMASDEENTYDILSFDFKNEKWILNDYQMSVGLNYKDKLPKWALKYVKEDE